MEMKRMVTPNYGVLRSLPSATVHRLLVPVTMAAYAVSMLLFVCALANILPDWTFWLRLSIGFWLFGNTWRRAVPLLWAEHGKLSYEADVTVCASSPQGTTAAEGTYANKEFVTLRIRTLQWWSHLSQTVCDATLLTLASLSVLLRYSHGAALALAWLIPPSAAPAAATSSTLFYVTFWTLPLLNVAASIAFYGVALGLNRMNPDRLASPRTHTALTLAACVIPLFSVPALLASMSAFSCTTTTDKHPQGVMTFAPATRCGSTIHRVHSVFAVLFLALGTLAMETAMGGSQLLQGPRPITAPLVFRCSKLTSEVSLAVKWVLIFVFTLGPHAIRTTLVLTTGICAVGFLLTRNWRMSNEGVLWIASSVSSLIVVFANALLLVISFFVTPPPQ